MLLLYQPIVIPVINLSDNLIKTEAIDNCRSKNWSSFLCILGLSSVIGISIQTVYPLQGKNDNCYFKLFSSLINPRTPAIHHDVLNILFYPSSFSKYFKCNHFVPLLIKTHFDCTVSFKRNQTDTKGNCKTKKLKFDPVVNRIPKV